MSKATMPTREITDAEFLAVIRAVLNDPWYGTEASYRGAQARMARTRAALAQLLAAAKGEGNG